MEPRALPTALGKFMVHLYNRSLIKIRALSCPGTRDTDCKTSCFAAWKHPETHFGLSSVSRRCHKEQLPSYRGSRTRPAYQDAHHPVLSLEQLIKSQKCSGGQPANLHTQAPAARTCRRSCEAHRQPRRRQRVRCKGGPIFPTDPTVAAGAAGGTARASPGSGVCWQRREKGGRQASSPASPGRKVDADTRLLQELVPRSGPGRRIPSGRIGLRGPGRVSAPALETRAPCVGPSLFPTH